MIKTAFLTAGMVLAGSLSSTLISDQAMASGFNPMNAMNPSKWFGGNNRGYDDDYYYDRHYGYPGYGYPGYGWGGGYPGYGYGYPGYGYPGYGYGPGTQNQSAPAPAPRPQ